MAVLMFLFWVVLNGRWTGEIAVFGLVLSAALYLFLVKFLDYKPRYDLILLKSLPQAVRYLLVLIREVALSALVMAGYVFDHRDIPEPVLVRFEPPLKTGLARVLLASRTRARPVFRGGSKRTSTGSGMSRWSNTYPAMTSAESATSRISTSRYRTAWGRLFSSMRSYRGL